jgi:hypothetical protein
VKNDEAYPLGLTGLRNLLRGASFSLSLLAGGGGSGWTDWSVTRCVILLEKKFSIVWESGMSREQKGGRNTYAVQLAYLCLGKLDGGHVFGTDVVEIEVELPAGKGLAVLFAKLYSLLLTLGGASGLVLVHFFLADGAWSGLETLGDDLEELVGRAGALRARNGPGLPERRMCTTEGSHGWRQDME